jgi:hypothetical protein
MRMPPAGRGRGVAHTAGLVVTRREGRSPRNQRGRTPIRVRTGVAHIDGEWWVVQNINGEITLAGEPPDGRPFTSEKTAEAGAALLIDALHRVLDERGIPWLPNEAMQ